MPNMPIVDNTETTDNAVTPISIARSVATLGCVSLAAPFVFGPLNLALHKMHMGSQSGINTTLRFDRPSFFTLAGIQYLIKSAIVMAPTVAQGYSTTAKASAIKNVTLSQRPNKEGNEIEKVEVEKVEQIEDRTNVNKSATSMIVLKTAAFGLGDTAITQWLANKNLFLNQAMYTQNNTTPFVAPAPTQAAGYLKVYFAGFGVRSASNITTLASYVVNPYITQLVDQALPQDMPHHKTAGAVLATLANGATVGIVSNAFAIVRTKQVVQIDCKQFTTPSAFTVMKDIMKKEGIKGFTRGASLSGIYSVVGLFAIPLLENNAEKLVAQTETAIRARMK